MKIVKPTAKKVADKKNIDVGIQKAKTIDMVPPKESTIPRPAQKS